MVIISVQAFTRSFEHGPWKYRGDEAIYFGAGKVIWHRGQVANKITEYHPPLSYYLNSLFLPDTSIDWKAVTDYSKLPEIRKNHWEQLIDSIGLDLVFQSMVNNQSIGWLFFRGRLPFVILSLFFLLSTALFLLPFGKSASLFGTSLFALYPPVLFFAPTMLTDFSFLVFFSWAAMCLFRYDRNKNNVKYLYLAAVTTALAISTKVSGLLIIIGFVISFIRDYFKYLNHSGHFKSLSHFIARYTLTVGIAFFTLWGIYGFQYDSVKNAEHHHFSFPTEKIFNEDIPDSKLKTHFPALYETKLPAVSFLMTFRYVYSLTKERFISDISPIIPGLNNPTWFWLNIVLSYIPFSILFGLALLTFQRLTSKIGLERGSHIFIILFFVFLFFTLRSPYQLGVRHYLPMYAMLLLFFSTHFKYLSKKWQRFIISWSAAIAIPWIISYGIFYIPQKWWLYLLLKSLIHDTTYGVLVN